jgi:hypothetical protein
VNRWFPHLRALALLGLCAVLVSGCAVPDGGYGYAGPVGYPGYYEPYGDVYGGWGPNFLVGPVGGGYRGGYYGGGYYRGGRGFAGGGRPAFHPAPGGRGMPSIPGGRGGGGFARGGGGGFARGGGGGGGHGGGGRR